MRNKTLGIVGIILFVIALLLVVADQFEIEFMNKLHEYGRYIAMLGGAFIGVGFFGKNKMKKK